MPTAAITGATGFLGTYLSYYLLQAGYEIKALKRETSSLLWSQKVFAYLNQEANQPVDFAEINWMDGDILDGFAMESLCADCDVLFHTAALVSFDAKDLNRMMQTNVDGTACVVDAALRAGLPKMVMASSVAALANPDNKKVLDESFQNSTFYRFETGYGESKYRAEMEVWRGMGEGLSVSVVNPSVILGAWRFVDSSVSMFEKVAQGLSLYPAGMGSFVDVRDVSAIMLQLAQREDLNGERYVLCGESLPFKDFLGQIARLLGKKPPSIKAGLALSLLYGYINLFAARLKGKSPQVTPALARAGNRHITFNTQKIEETLNFSFRPLDDTLKWTSAFYKSLNS